MKQRLYTIQDKKSLLNNPPFAQNNNAEAIRSFADLVRDKNTTISKHPEDYNLWAIAEWDNITCQIESIEKLLLANGEDFINKKGDE